MHPPFLPSSLPPLFPPSSFPSLPPSLSQVDLQKSLRNLEEKETELRRSRASLREKEAELQVDKEFWFSTVLVLHMGDLALVISPHSVLLCILQGFREELRESEREKLKLKSSVTRLKGDIENQRSGCGYSTVHPPLTTTPLPPLFLAGAWVIWWTLSVTVL